MKLLLLLLFITSLANVSPSDDTTTVIVDSSVTTQSVDSTPTPDHGSVNATQNSSLTSFSWYDLSINYLMGLLNTSKEFYDGVKGILQYVYNSTSFNLVTNFTSEIYENIKSVLRKVISEQSMINFAYKTLGIAFGNLTDPGTLDKLCVWCVLLYALLHVPTHTDLLSMFAELDQLKR